jgi:hypothetical protein
MLYSSENIRSQLGFIDNALEIVTNFTNANYYGKACNLTDSSYNSLNGIFISDKSVNTLFQKRIENEIY